MNRYTPIGMQPVRSDVGKYVKHSDAMTEIEKLKEQIVKMRVQCNKRFSEQLHEIRKLKAANMLQTQNALFDN